MSKAETCAELEPAETYATELDPAELDPAELELALAALGAVAPLGEAADSVLAVEVSDLLAVSVPADFAPADPVEALAEVPEEFLEFSARLSLR